MVIKHKTTTTPLQHNPGQMPAVPLTILTGFLGAGKSTLLRYILHSQHGLRVAVIMNEFGDAIADLDRPAIDSGGVWLNLPNGCVCCAGVDRGLKAIEELLINDSSIEWVLLEASGMADPCSLIARLWSDTGSPSRLDGVVCVLDASRADLYNTTLGRLEAIKQVAMADLVIVNKTDLVNYDTRSIDQIIDSSNPQAARIRTVNCSVPLSHLYNLGAYQRLNIPDLFKSLSLDLNPHPQPITPIQLYLPSSAKVSLKQFEDWFFPVLWEYSLHLDGKIFRMKGHVDKWYVQSVDTIYDVNMIDHECENVFVLMIGSFTRADVGKLKDSFYIFFTNH